MITREQIVQARKLLGWSQMVLAAKTEVSEWWIREYERQGLTQPAEGRLVTTISTFAAAGIEFTGGASSSVRSRKAP